MSARIINSCAAALRLRRHFDVDGVTVWFVTASFLMLASAAALAAA